jgi:hypothetical protein
MDCSREGVSKCYTQLISVGSFHQAELAAAGLAAAAPAKLAAAAAPVELATAAS